MQDFSDNEPENMENEIEKEGKPNGSGKSNLLVALLLVLAVGTIALYAYMKSQNSDFNKLTLKGLFSPSSAAAASENTYAAVRQISYDIKENASFSVYKDFIAKAGSNGIKLLDKSGNEVWNESVPVNKPLIRTNGSELLVADLAGRDIFVISGKVVKWHEKAADVIVNVDISSDGYVTLLCRAKGYGGEVRVFDPAGIELFKTYIVQNVPVASRISPSSRMLTVDCISTSGVKVQTYLKTYDMEGKETGGHLLEPPNSIYPLLWCAGEDYTYLAGDNVITCRDRDGGQKWVKQYDAVYSACISGGSNLAAAVRDKSGVSVKILGINGRELAESPFDSEIRNLASYGSIIAVNLVREVWFMNDRGEKSGKYTSKSDVLGVYFFSRHEAVVVSKNNISVINITR